MHISMHEFSFACACRLDCALSVWPCKALGQKQCTHIAHLVVAIFCTSTSIAVSGLAKVENWRCCHKSLLLCNRFWCRLDFLDNIVLGGSHSANCQSAGSQIDPISFILQRTICKLYYHVFQKRFLLRFLAWFQHLKSQGKKYAKK